MFDCKQIVYILKKGVILKARKSDPWTSFAASASVKDLTETKKAILALLFDEGLTDDQLLVRYRKMADLGLAPVASDSGIRSRRAELVDAGFVHAVDVGRSRFGRSSLVWGVKRG